MNNITKFFNKNYYKYTVVFSILINLLLIYFIYFIFFSSDKKNTKVLLDKTNQVNKEIIENEKNIKKISEKLNDIKKNFSSVSTSYFKYQEIDAFYRKLSNLAVSHDLKIKNIDKKILENTNNSEDKNNKNIVVFEYNYLLEGSFKDYLNLRNDLSIIDEKIIIISEIINRLENEKAGIVSAKAMLQIPTIKDIINKDIIKD